MGRPEVDSVSASPALIPVVSAPLLPCGSGWRTGVAGLLMAVMCAACNFQEWSVTITADRVGAGADRVGITLCRNGLEYRNLSGYGQGISDVELSFVGPRVLVRYCKHTFAGPATKIRERLEFTLP